MVRSKQVVNIPGMGDHLIFVYRLHSYHVIIGLYESSIDHLAFGDG